MSLNSMEYLIFFLGITLLLYAVVPMKFRWVVLAAASCFFYCLTSRYLIVFPVLTALSVYYSGLLTDALDTKKNPGLRKSVLLLTVILNIGVLAWLRIQKHSPLGISFYTLQALSYAIDVYRGKYKAEHNFRKIFLFVIFFPQITEGPIGRYDLLADQLNAGRPVTFENFRAGVTVILCGMFKKVVIADRANSFLEEIFTNYGKYSGLAVVLAVLIYTLQIYADFSGCIDIATGSAKLFGIDMSQNFIRPIFSHSVAEFWRRWHVTLGTWLRDYVFYPVSLSDGLSAVGKWSRKRFSPYFGAVFPTICAIFFVWVGNGVWHGSGWHYFAYGMYYFAITVCGILFEPHVAKLCAKLKLNRKSRAFGIFQMIRTFIFVNIGMMLFRALSLKVFIRMFLSIFRDSGLSVFRSGAILKQGMDKYDFWVLAIGAVLIFITEYLEEKGHDLKAILFRQKTAVQWIVFYALIFLILIYGAYGGDYAPVDPIYAHF